MPRSSGLRQNECTFEVRYKANSKVLDHRGEWAAAIAAHLHLEHWRIDQNRIDVSSEGDKIHGFVSYRNCGLTVSDVPNQDYFPNYVENFLGFVFGLTNFDNPIKIDRIGVRQKFCTAFASSFDELLKRYSTRYLSIPQKAWESIGPESKLTDIGGHLNFLDETGNFNTMSGPMLQKQFSEYFSVPGDFPKVGLYYEIDYWTLPKKSMAGEQVVGTINSLFTGGWSRHRRVRELIISR